MPDFSVIFGYANASWTLRVGLLGQYLSRLLSYMDAHGYDTVRPADPDPGMATRPLLNLTSGYIARAFEVLPRQGTGGPWRTAPVYSADARALRQPPGSDPELRFSSSRAEAPV